MNNSVNTRQSGLDIAKIVAMLMVVTLHALSYFGGLKNTDSALQYNISWFLETLAYPAVNIFALISGYLLYEKAFSKSRVINFCVQVLSTSIIVYAVLLVTGVVNFSLRDAITSLLPITLGGYWFAQSYFVVLLLSPFMNKLISALKGKELLTLNIILLIFFSILPMLLNNFGWNVGRDGTIILLVLYIYGASYKRYIKEGGKKPNKYLALAAYFVVCLLTFASRFVIGYLCKVLSLATDYSGLFYSYNTIPIILAALSLFVYFEQVDIKHGKKTVSIISAASFAVYLLHMQPVLSSLYNTKFNLNAISKSNMYFPMVFVSIIVVFVVGVAFEIFRGFVFKKTILLFKKKEKNEEKQ